MTIKLERIYVIKTDENNLLHGLHLLNFLVLKCPSNKRRWYQLYRHIADRIIDITTGSIRLDGWPLIECYGGHRARRRHCAEKFKGK